MTTAVVWFKLDQVQSCWS